MWLTRWGGTFRESSSPGIAYQGSLAGVPLSMSAGDSNISSPAAAMVASPRTAVTQGQQSQNVSATLPIFQPGNAPVNNTAQVGSSAKSGVVIGAVIVFALLLFSGMKVK